MPDRIPDATTKFAIMMSGVQLNPDEIGDRPKLVGFEDPNSRYVDVSQIIERFRSAPGMEKAGLKIFIGVDDYVAHLEKEKSSHFDMITVAREWTHRSYRKLHEIVIRKVGDVVEKSRADAALVERMHELNPTDLPTLILHDDENKMRLLAAAEAQVFAVLYNPEIYQFVMDLTNSLHGVLINHDEDPTLKLVSLHSYAELLSSNFRYTLKPDELEMAASTLYRMLKYSDGPNYLKEAAVSAVGFMSTNWPTYLPSRPHIVEELEKYIREERAVDLKRAAIRAYGVMYANLMVDEEKIAGIVETLKDIEHESKFELLRQDASTLLKIIGSCSPQLVNSPRGNGTNSAPTGSGVSGPGNGTPPPSSGGGIKAAIGRSAMTSFFTYMRFPIRLH